jgi:integrase
MMILIVAPICSRQTSGTTIDRRPALRATLRGVGKNANGEGSITYDKRRKRWRACLIRGGVDVRTVADILGNVDPAMTLRRYTRVLLDMRERAASVIDGYSV